MVTIAYIGRYYSGFYDIQSLVLQILPDNSTIEIAIVGKTMGWLGFGLAANESAVPNGDFVIGSVSPQGLATVQDYWGSNHVCMHFRCVQLSLMVLKWDAQMEFA